MTEMDGESFKGGVHFMLGSLVATVCLYNALEWSRRRELHLALNVAVYAPLWGFELYQTFRHWRQP